MCLKYIVIFMGLIQLVTSTNFRVWHTDAAYNDLIAPSGYQPHVTYARSVLDCGTKCGQEDICQSFFYANTTAVCQLHNVVLTTTSGLNSTQSSKYYYKKVVQYPTFTCPADDTVYRTVTQADGSLFTYKVYKVFEYKDTAVSNCVADGAHLVRIDSIAKMAVLRQLSTTCAGYDLGYWIDLTNINASNFSDINQWVSSVGIPFPAGNDFWEAAEPTSPTTTHCAYYWTLYIRDLACTGSSTNYICEKDSP